MRPLRPRKVARLLVTVAASVAVCWMIIEWKLRDGLFEHRTFKPRPSTREQSVYIAAMFHQSERVLPSFIDNLMHMIPNFHSTFISIVENGSTDNTKRILEELDSRLTELKIPHNITTSTAVKAYNERISYLSGHRNSALFNMYDQHARLQIRYDKLIFFNDIMYDPVDFMRMFEAPSLAGNGGYDAICGMDYYSTFYDNFATRESQYHTPSISQDKGAIGGLKPDSWRPHFYSTERQRLFAAHELIPVFSCWNGVAIFKTEPFYRHHLHFRALSDGKSRQTRGFDASECCLIHADIRAHNPHARIYIDPNFIVRYRPQSWGEWASWWIGYLRPLWTHPFTPLQPSAELVTEARRLQALAKEQGFSD
eukprot:Partr_v1_DN28083_c2_g1_i2_m56866 putative capsular associated protein